jgi:hypothetical protein
VISALALMAGFAADANAAVRFSDGTTVSLDVNCIIDAGGKYVKYVTGSTSTGVWYRVFTRAYDANWRFISSGTTAWIRMDAGNSALAPALVAGLFTPTRNYVFEVQFFKNGVYTGWYSSTPQTTNYYNYYSPHTDYGICRL